jgi:hypothetical protein
VSGERGGIYYLNARGKRVYQKKRPPQQNAIAIDDDDLEPEPWVNKRGRPKQWVSGERSGMYYLNASGKRVYQKKGRGRKPKFGADVPPSPVY